MAERTHTVFRISFSSGATQGSNSISMHGFAFGIVHVPAEFNSDVLTFSSVGDWGTNSVMTKTVSTGANTLTAEEIAKVGGVGVLSVSTDNATSGASQIWLELKS